MNLKIQNRII